MWAMLGGAASASGGALQLDERFGQPDPGRFDRVASTTPPGAPDYWREVRPVLDQRCVACHACYDAPCQLNLSRYDGITRGATTLEVYAFPRLTADAPTRLGIDAGSMRAWRQKGFFPVLNERDQTPEANRAGGVMARLLAQKRQAPRPPPGKLADPDIDFSLDRKQVCATAEGIDAYLQSHPTRGMPFALPPLGDSEYDILTRWLEAGAPYRPPPPLPAVVQRQIGDWERFLNGDGNKVQLSARYIYEHWYIGHLWFPELPGQYFELVRSRTPPGMPVERIATRRPYDDPGVARVYYRLVRLETTPVAKTHMPLRLDPARLTRLRQWFIAPDYAVDELPGHAPEIAANPFVTFRALPLEARYRLMLEEAQFTLLGFMKGPVCRGQVALNSIDDHFWVVFLAPNKKEFAFMQRLIDGAMPTLQLPAERDGATSLLTWQRYADLEGKYLDKKRALIEQLRGKGVRPTLADIWDGDGTNANAALTVFRHFDSASVQRGLIGDRPQTAFVMGYPLLERMHYLLTAGFDVFGSLSHQLSTRLYMDFLRMESQLNFLAFLPRQDRQGVFDHWYRGHSQPHERYFADASASFPEETGVRFSTRDSLAELYGLLQERMAPLREKRHVLAGSGLGKATLVQLERLGQVRGVAASILPEDSLLRVTRKDGTAATISILRNSAHSNVAELFDEQERRLPAEDTLTIQHGIVGAYPNAIFIVDETRLADFVATVAGLRNEDDLLRLADGYAVRRTDSRFWSVSDRLHADYRQRQPIEYGVLDYSRLENF